MKIANSSNNIPQAFFSLAEAHPGKSVFSQAVADSAHASSEQPRKWAATSYEDAEMRIRQLAAFLREKGVGKGDTVAIVSASRPEWMYADLAILSLGAVCVSVYHSLPADDIAYILFDSGADFVFVENEEQLEKIRQLQSEEQDIPATEDREGQRVQISLRAAVSFEQVEEDAFVTTLQSIYENQSEQAQLPETIRELTREDLASIVYTSGTTGPPKGVLQTHGNHLANVRQAFESKMCNNRDSLALFLPLAHSFARLMGYVGFLTQVELRFPAVVDKKSSRLDPESVSKDIREGSATINPVVPRLLEKMRDGVNAKAEGSGFGSKLLSLCLWAAKERYDALKKGQTPGLDVRLAYAATGFLREKIRKKLFGDTFNFCVSGGAKLNLSVNEYFDALGIPIIQGYGLTETCVATNVDRMNRRKLDSVGPVLSDDIEIKLEEDGEILFRGPNVAKGYHNRPTATSKSWDSDNWYHTGDLGELDEDGYLRIIGRKKEIIVTSGGKNIAPHDIEEEIKKHPLVSQSVLIGDGRKYCVALVALKPDAAEKWCKANCEGEDEPVHQASEVFATIWEHVSKMNDTLASYETVKRIYIVPEEFSVENGLLTPTFKTKLPAVEEKYSEEIEQMYP